MLKLLAYIVIPLAIVSCGGAGGKASNEWSLVLSGMPAALTSVWGVSANDIWAVGSDPTGAGNTVLHFDGSKWDKLPTGFSGDLWWVFGFEEGPVFMGGKDGLILRYENGKFQRMPTPGTATVYGIWGTEPSDMWAAGGNVTSGAFAWRFDGDSWRRADSFPPDLANSDSLFKVWGRANDDVWFVGTNGVVLHYDGQRIIQEPSATTLHLFTVSGDSQRVAAVGGLGRGVIVESKGAGWNDVTPKDAPHVIGIWLQSDQGYAVGVEGSVLSLENDAWKRVDTGFKMAEAFHAVWVDPDGGVWAVGGNVLAPPLINGVMIHKPEKTIVARPNE